MSTSKRFTPVNFGRYLLQERIAIGGMAEIFRAKFFGAMGFEKPVVIKRILPQFAADAEFLRMFITEAKLVCHLEHPNIAQVYELGEIDGRYYIAMEHINGIDGRQLWRTLAKRKQRLPGVLALFVVAEFAKGLDYAHRAVGPDNQLLGVVHRDVSPSNILINFRGDVKIGDFGIALVQQESKTQAGVLKGKYGYMSPEQVAGLPVDHRSDIFAAGIVLTELLLGRRLFLGRSDFETLDKVMNVKLEILEQHEKALPPEIVRIARLALQRDPADRYQSARDLHDDVMEFLFSRGERISNDTLAAFIAQHVAPYLARKGDKGTETGADVSADISGAAIAAQSPVVPRDLVPRIDTSDPELDEDEAFSLDLSAGGGPIALVTSDLIESIEAYPDTHSEQSNSTSEGSSETEPSLVTPPPELNPLAAAAAAQPAAPPVQLARVRLQSIRSDAVGIRVREQGPTGQHPTEQRPAVPVAARQAGEERASERGLSEDSALSEFDEDSLPVISGPVDASAFDRAGGQFGTEADLFAADESPDAAPGTPSPAGAAASAEPARSRQGAQLSPAFASGKAHSGAEMSPITGPVLAASRPEFTPGAGEGPQFALWDNVIDADYQFGAIPQLDLGEVGTGDLDLDGFVEESFREVSSRPDAYLDAPGTEVDLESGLEENIAFHVHAIPAEAAPQDIAPAQAAMLSAQLERALEEEASPGEQADFAGQLGTRTMAKVLLRFGVVGETGRLTITGPERPGAFKEHLGWLNELLAQVSKQPLVRRPHEQTCEIRLEQGQPKRAAADRSEAALVAHLLTEGDLERDDVEGAVKAHSHRGLVTALINVGKLSPLQISRQVTAYVLDSTLSAFAWQAGTFAFHRGKTTTTESFPTGMDFVELIRKGIAAIPDQVFIDYVATMEGLSLQIVGNPPASLAAFQPGQEVYQLYRALSTTPNAEQALQACAGTAPLPALRRALYTLVECEFVSLA